MTRRLLACIAALLAIPGAALAITFFPTDVPDPFKPGAKCKVQSLGSYGSYIYGWPSKYDQVFSPFIDPPMFWRCRGSGYVAHASEFDKTPEDRKAAVQAWLAEHPADVDKLAFPELLDRVQAINEVRGSSAEDQAWFWRMRAVHAPDTASADAYRARALPLLQGELQRTDLPSFARLSTLYLVGYYARRGGQAELSEESFKAMSGIEWRDPEGTLAEALEYFAPMIADVRAGKLDGDCGATMERPPACPALTTR